MNTKLKLIIRFKGLFIATTIAVLLGVAYFSGFELTKLSPVVALILLFVLFIWYVSDAEKRAYKQGQEDMAHSSGKVKNPFYKGK